MKKLALVLVVATVVTGTAWLGWFRQPARQEEADTQRGTEVAVHIGKITRATLRAYVTAYGTVEPEPAGEHPAASANVAPSVAGVLVAVNCVEGQHVAKGDVLFQLDSRAADVAVEFAQKNLERQKRLIGIQGTSEKALQEAQQQLDAARVQQALLRVQAPLSGTVTRVNVKPGEAVDLMTVLAELVDLDRLVVSARVPSTELAALEPGQSVDVLADEAASPVVGTLDFISPQVDVQTGTALTRTALPAGSGLRPGQFVSARIVSTEHENRLAVPVESVVKDERGRTVISIVQDDTAVRKPVKTDLRDGRLVEVEADGLQAGMTVVTEGAYGLPEETRIRVLPD
jgi:RND family efflux transporter MFP subunit